MNFPHSSSAGCISLFWYKHLAISRMSICSWWHLLHLPIDYDVVNVNLTCYLCIVDSFFKQALDFYVYSLIPVQYNLCFKFSSIIFSVFSVAIDKTCVFSVLPKICAGAYNCPCRNVHWSMLPFRPLLIFASVLHLLTFPHSFKHEVIFLAFLFVCLFF